MHRPSDRGVLSDEKAAALKRRYERLNPVRLRREIEAALEGLWALREQTKPDGARQLSK